MVLLFNGYGLGLIGRTGPAIGLVVALGVFGLQLIASTIWLRNHLFGPAEWVWRSLTYGQMQPMRRPVVAAERPVVAIP